MPTYALDACALIALHRLEDGWKVVQDLLYLAEQQKIKLIMNIVNLVEVFYDRVRNLPVGDGRRYVS